MKTIATWLLLLSCTQALTSAHAQDVWRCGADGRSYGSTPCSEGRLVVAAGVARPAADVQAAQAFAAREAALADQLRRERRQEEARALGNGAGSLPTAARRPAFKPEAAAPRVAKAPKATKNPAKPRQHQPAADGTSTAVAPASRRTKG